MLNLSPAERFLARFVYILLTSISATGAIANLSLFFVTLRSKSLRSTCHLLIGLCALLDGFHHIGQFYQFPILYSDGLIDSFTCSVLQLIPEIGVVGGCACILSIGIERLTAVVFINQYRRFGHRLLALHFLLIASFAAYVVYLMVAYFEPKWHICAIPAPFHGGARALWTRALGMLTVATILVYSIVAIVMSRSSKVSTATRKAFRSIFFVMTSDVTGWAIGISLLRVTNTIDITNEIRFIMHYFCGLFVHSGIGAKAIIYYSTSTEYRQAFQSVFGRVQGSTSVHTHSTAISTTEHITVI